MKGDWITFAELCDRMPEKSARTLNRMVKERQLSFRQRVQGGKREFNWVTVQSELAALERSGRLRRVEIAPPPAELTRFAELLEKLTNQVEALTVEVRERRTA